MARMRRIQLVMEPQLDDWLEREAAARGISKSALVRECLHDRAAASSDNGLRALIGVAGDAEPVDDIDEFLYGPVSGDA